MSNLIVAGWFLYLGFMPLGDTSVDGGSLDYNTTFIQTAGVNFTVAGFFRVFTEIEIRDVKSDKIYFDPYRADFEIGAEFMYRNFFLGIFHECDHDIVTGNIPNRANGFDGAYNEIYSGWSFGFSAHPQIRIKPAFVLGFRGDGAILLKKNTEEGYFDFDSLRIVDEYNSLFGRIGGEIDFFRLVKLNLAFRTDFSLTHGRWSSLCFDTGLELYYRNIAAGIEWNKRLNLKNSGWGFNEFSLYIKLSGSAPLF